MTPWYEIYRERMNARYLEHVTVKYAPFIQALYKTRGRIMTEIGCGAGNITRIVREMSETNQWFHLTDSCPKMLSLAIENNPDPRCNFSCADIRKWVPAECDVVHSHGLLEHFDDADIRHIVENMFYAAPIQLHYVPGAKYEKPSRGDERLLSPAQWETILKKLGHVAVTTFNDGYDMILRIER